jgi:hypothetical protein
MYQHLITKRKSISDTALNVIRDAYNIALSLEVAELETNKKLIEGRLSEIGGGL